MNPNIVAPLPAGEVYGLTASLRIEPRAAAHPAHGAADSKPKLCYQTTQIDSRSLAREASAALAATFWLLLVDTKNGESRRLPIDSILLHELSEHRTRVKNEELVFPSFERNGNVVPLNDVNGSFDKALSDVGIKNFRFHDLRHTFASHYMMSGGELYTLSKILGHKDLKMTQRYAKLSSKFIEGELGRMDIIWTPAQIPTSETTNQEPTKCLQ
jgi:hypothetical protein